MAHIAKILLLGSGELGREFAISAKRLGAFVVACDAYADAPAMQIADASEVIPMLDAKQLRAAIEKHRPDHIVPEIEAIRTETLVELEREGYRITPSARAAQLTMNRDAIRDLAAQELGLATSRYRYATDLAQVRQAVETIGMPCVVKPVMSSSGKGQSRIESANEIEPAWNSALSAMRGDRARVIVEEFIAFDFEITLLTVRHPGGYSFCQPIGHRQEGGDYRESWQSADMQAETLARAQDMARVIVDALKGEGSGHGLYGVEFFVRRAGSGVQEVIFSELSPRPHDTGMVTLISQRLSEFDLHARAVLGLPVPAEIDARPSASAVILADRDSHDFAFENIAEALGGEMEGEASHLDLRLFGKPATRPGRRMGVALATGTNVAEARDRASRAAAKVRIAYRD